MSIQSAIERLRTRIHVPMFAADVWDRDLDAALRDGNVEELFEGMEIRQPHMAAAAVAGLLARK